MRSETMPTSVEGKLLHLIQECAEVQQIVTKLMMFGSVGRDPITLIEYDNQKLLQEEMNDLKIAVERVEQLYAISKKHNMSLSELGRG